MKSIRHFEGVVYQACSEEPLRSVKHGPQPGTGHRQSVPIGTFPVQECMYKRGKSLICSSRIHPPNFPWTLHLPSGLRRRSRCGRRLCGRRGLLARRNVRNSRQVCDLPSGCIGDVNVGVIEQQTSGAIKFDPRFLVRSLCRNQIRLARGKRSGILQDCGLRGETDS